MFIIAFLFCLFCPIFNFLHTHFAEISSVIAVHVLVAEVWSLIVVDFVVLNELTILRYMRS